MSYDSGEETEGLTYDQLTGSDKAYADDWRDFVLKDETGMEDWTLQEREDYWRDEQSELNRMVTYMDYPDYVSVEVRDAAWAHAFATAESKIVADLEENPGDQSVLQASFEMLWRADSGNDLDNAFFFMRDIYRHGIRIAIDADDQKSVDYWREEWGITETRSPAKEEDPERYERANAIMEAGSGNPGASAALEAIIANAEDEEVISLPNDDLKVEELVSLLQKVKETPLDERYDLVLTMHGDQLIYDRLGGFSDNLAASNIAATIGSLRKTGQDITAPGSFDGAIDIGAGTGNTTGHVQGQRGISVSNVSLLDIHPGMKSHLDERFKDQEDVEAFEGSAEELPLGDDSTELAYSLGMGFHLNAEQTDGLFGELARVLKSGGVFVDAYRDGDITNSEYDSWKNALKDVIVDTVTGRIDATDGVTTEQQTEIAVKHGFSIHQSVKGNIVTRVFVKDGQLQDRGFTFHDGHGARRIQSIVPNAA